MAKELPYFRFTSQEWQNGLISLESYAMKGLFIDVCAYYWVQDCTVTRKMLTKKFRNARKNLQELIEIGLLKHDDSTDQVVILFLNEQFDLLSENRKNKAKAGKKGGEKRASNARDVLKQEASYKDKDKENNKDKDNDNPTSDKPTAKNDIFPDKSSEGIKKVLKDSYPDIHKKLVAGKLSLSEAVKSAKSDEPKKPAKKKKAEIGPNFLQDIINLWSYKYHQARGNPWVITAIGKERAAASRLSQIHRQSFPDDDTEAALDKIGQYMDLCLKIKDDWLRTNMSLSIMVSKFNEIRQYLNETAKGSNGSSQGVDEQELAEILQDHFKKQRESS